MSGRPVRFAIVVACLAVTGLLPQIVAAADSTSDAAWVPAQTQVVIAGVLEWKNPGLAPFSKANRKDEELYHTLLKRGVPAKNARLLLDEEATRSAILDAVREAARATDKQGTLIFYYAGHGQRLGDRFYLASYDAGRDAEQTSLPVSEIAAILKSEFHGQRVLLMADCCHSGGLREAARVVADSGRQAATLTSVAPDGLSTGNWTFTETLLDGFRGRSTVDRNSDGTVSFGEMADDVRDAMKYVERQSYGFANFGVPHRFGMSLVGNRSSLPAGSRFRLGQFVTARDATGWVNGRVIGYQEDRWQVELQSYATRPVLRVSEDDIDEIPTPKGSTPSGDVPAVAEVEHQVGAEILAEWGRQMWPAKVIGPRNGDGLYKIHYIGWAASFDELVPAERILAVEEKLGPSDALAESDGLWWPVKILKESKSRSRVHYIGWADTWDEWVGPSRLRKGQLTQPAVAPESPPKQTAAP